MTTALTDRDVAIISMVYSYEGCAIDHIRRRYFSTPGARTPCYRRVAHLVRHGFLVSSRLPSHTGTGSGKAFLTIGSDARPVLSQILGIPRSELTRSRFDSPIFIAHHMALCDARLSFELAAECSRVIALQDWTGDRENHKSPVHVKDPRTGKDLPMIPDATFSLILAL